MSQRLTVFWCCVAILIGGVDVYSAAAQTGGLADEAPIAVQSGAELTGAGDKTEEIPATTALSVRQERVLRLLEELESRLMGWAAEREASGGGDTAEAGRQQAHRLVQVLQEARRRQLPERVRRVIELLNQEKLDRAGSEQERIAADLQVLIDLLSREEVDRYLEQQRAALEVWRQAIERLIAQQSGLRQQSAELVDPTAAIAQTVGALERLRKLIEDQEKLADRTQRALAKAAHELAGLAEPQYGLGQTSRALAGRGGQSGSEDLAEERVANGLIRQAAGYQEQAAEFLRHGRGQRAWQEQQQALDFLRQAVQQLVEKQRRLESLSDQAAGRLAGQQLDLAQQTGQLVSQMGGKGSDGSEASREPGVSELLGARGEMSRAGSALTAGQPGQALPAQDRALQMLERARQRIEQTLAEFQRQMQQEILADLVWRFSRMLEQQRAVTAATRDLAENVRARWTRMELLACEQLVRRQRAIAEMAREALEIVQREGTSLVLPYVVQQLHQDLMMASQLLAQQRVGSEVDQVQRRAEKRLEQLLEALDTAKSRLSSEGSQPPTGAEGFNGQGSKRLLATSTELKLLRRAQEAINQETASIGGIGTELEKNTEATGRRERLRLLAEEQEILQKLAERLVGRP